MRQKHFPAECVQRMQKDGMLGKRYFMCYDGVDKCEIVNSEVE